MPNFAILCPIIIYLPAIIIALVAVIVCVTHCIVAWPGRRPAVQTVVQTPVGVCNDLRRAGLPYSYRGRGNNGTIYANIFADTEQEAAWGERSQPPFVRLEVRNTPVFSKAWIGRAQRLKKSLGLA